MSVNLFKITFFEYINDYLYLQIKFIIKKVSRCFLYFVILTSNYGKYSDLLFFKSQHIRLNYILIPFLLHNIIYFNVKSANKT